MREKKGTSAGSSRARSLTFRSVERAGTRNGNGPATIPIAVVGHRSQPRSTHQTAVMLRAAGCESDFGWFRLCDVRWPTKPTTLYRAVQQPDLHRHAKAALTYARDRTFQREAVVDSLPVQKMLRGDQTDDRIKRIASRSAVRRSRLQSQSHTHGCNPLAREQLLRLLVAGPSDAMRRKRRG
jgi:hypothetical protein